MAQRSHRRAGAHLLTLVGLVTVLAALVGCGQQGGSAAAPPKAETSSSTGAASPEASRDASQAPSDSPTKDQAAASGTQSPAPKTANKEARDLTGEPATAKPPAEATAPAHSRLFHFADTPEKGLAEAKRRKGYLVLKFEATWCAPCQVMKRELFTSPEIAKLMDKATFVSVDVDSPLGQRLSEKYKVESIPLLLFQKPNGQPFGAIVGYQSVPWFKKWLKRTLAKA